MTSQPLVSVYKMEDSLKVHEKKVSLPGVFSAAIRDDIVQFVHKNLNKNKRQAHGVAAKAGMKHSAASWGTGRAVARIPRIGGSGTSRSGQGAFGNMCRKGRMFAPLKTWRRWHRKVNIKQRRHAAAAAIAASGCTPLVLARGHKVQNVPELPLVVDDKLESIEKTKEAVAFLKRFGVYDDVLRVVKSKKLRAGKGKLRNRRFTQRRGPLVIYSNESVKMVQAFRNVPGVDVCNVTRMNLLQLAPGGQLGRMVIWTQSAFAQLDTLFGSQNKPAFQKKGYQLHRACMTSGDLARIINSNEIQSVLRPVKRNVIAHDIQKKNPLKNRNLMDKLNPAEAIRQKQATAQNEANKKKRAETMAAKRAGKKVPTMITKDEKKRKVNSKNFMKSII